MGPDLLYLVLVGGSAWGHAWGTGRCRRRDKAHAAAGPGWGEPGGEKERPLAPLCMARSMAHVSVVGNLPPEACFHRRLGSTGSNSFPPNHRTINKKVTQHFEAATVLLCEILP